MIEDQAREDIAFIRQAVAEGRNYATARSPEMLIWGIALAIGYFGTYAFVRGLVAVPSRMGVGAEPRVALALFTASAAARFRARLRRPSDGRCAVDAVA